MEIYIDGVGLIQNSSVRIDGLTVIAGENNSGKSTVGKVLYAIADGTIDIDRKQEMDEYYYCRDILLDDLRSIAHKMLRFQKPTRRTLFLDTGTDSEELPSSAIHQILTTDLITHYPSKEKLSDYMHNLERELSDLQYLDTVFHFSKYSNNEQKKERVADFENLQKNAQRITQKIIKILTKGTNSKLFMERYMNYTLRAEFQGEIQPVRKRGIESNVSFSDNRGIIFQCTIKDDNIMRKDFKAFKDTFSKAYFIDNAFILDSVHSRPTWQRRRDFDAYDETIINTSSILTHTEKLIHYLRRTTHHNITHELDIIEKYNKVKSEIVSILPGTFKNTLQGLKYEYEGASLKAANLATGSKMFGIIKMILDRYDFNDSTMLILDEPEAHLHPRWQSIFAEVIVLLVKELGVRVLLTSHSSHFVLALDAHMRKYNIQDKTNFYQTSIMEDGFVKFVCVNDDLTAIYDDFATYFAHALELRDRIFYGEA